MIVTFSIANFRSFHEEETFSMVASSKINDHPSHVVAIPGSDEKVLRAAVMYGANGAGKSNVFKALEYLKWLALEPRPKGSGMGRDAFRFGVGTPEIPTALDLQFISNDDLYRYGIKVDDHRVLEEWLVHIQGDIEYAVFERRTSESGSVEVRLGETVQGDKLKALASIGGLPSQSFLAFVRASLDPSEFGDAVSDAIVWFAALTAIGPNHRFPLEFNRGPVIEFSSQFLRSASTGVDHLVLEEIQLGDDEVRMLVPDEGDTLLSHARSGNPAFLGTKNGLIADPKRSGVFMNQLRAAHAHRPGQLELLPLNEESDGTRRLLDLTPALFKLQTGTQGVFFIDEVDRSLHPELVHKFVEFYLNSCSGEKQLILTSHETSLLDQDLFRHDEIWFVEKDAAGASHMYSLTDFKVRDDLELRKGYLQGRFGAIPFLGDLDRLMEKSTPK